MGLLLLWVPTNAQAPPAPQREFMQYEVEWRLIRAGTAQLTWSGAAQAKLRLFSTGLVSTLMKIEDVYNSNYDPDYCAISSLMNAHEGRRLRETKVTFDRESKKASFLEKDLQKNSIVTQKEIEIPACVHDPLGALEKLRRHRLEVGQSWELPVSDGKKLISARVECQEREQVKTPVGTFNALKHEAFLFNGVLYGRKGRLFIWFSDDERRLPVQIRIQLPFYVGTVTLQLEKLERI